MKQISPLTKAEEITLTEAHHNHPVFRVRQRAHALLLNRRGYSMARLRELFEVQHETVSRWLKRWDSEGITGLMDEARSGCPLKLDEEDVNFLVKAIKKNPHQLTVAHDQLQEKTGKEVSRDTLKRALKKNVTFTSVVASLANTNAMKPTLSGTVKSLAGSSNRRMKGSFACVSLMKPDFP